MWARSGKRITENETSGVRLVESQVILPFFRKVVSAYVKKKVQKIKKV